jgi:hypothetical protein
MAATLSRPGGGVLYRAVLDSQAHAAYRMGCRG